MIKKLYKKWVPERKRNNLRYFFFRMRSVFYSGDNFYCNCCEHSFRKFLTYGNIPRANALCPYCHSLERTRLLLSYLQRETPIFKGGYSILHFAPEPILEAKLKKTNNEYLSADINPELADHEVDITKIPFPDNHFDFIICSHVLGHVPDEHKAIDEMYRVLKTGGRTIILTVIDHTLEQTFEDKNIHSKEDRLKYYGEGDLARRHGRDFQLRLERKGMTIEKNPYYLTFNEEERKRFSLGNGDREIIFNCIKH